MPTTVEVPEQDQQARTQVAPPIQATATVEVERGITAVRDEHSKVLVNKANTNVTTLLNNILKSSLKLAKTAFKSVAHVFTTFNGLKRIIGGL